jgi:hypothetical protein
VIQVGDLIHKGPDSSGCIAIVDRFLSASPDQWIQLLGNHEAQYLGGHSIAPALPELLQFDLQRWTASGQARIAVAITTVELGAVLVTHSGITREKWIDVGQSGTAREVADALNEEWERDPSAAFTPGGMLIPGQKPGVVWAEAAGELLASWANMRTLPFSQVHGHTSPYDWSSDRWQPNVPRRLLEYASVDLEARRTEVEWPSGRKIVGIDPGYGTRGANVPLTPLLLTGAES